MFGFLMPGLSVAEKQSRVIAKVRSQPTINLWQILTAVVKYLPPGKYAQVYFACGDDRFWTLGVSLLGINTILAGKSAAQLGFTPQDINDWCNTISTKIHWRLGVDQLGVDTFLSPISYIDLANFLADAFQYEVRIFETSLSMTDFQAMDAELKRIEPARSTHTIRQNLSLAAFGLTNTVPNAGQFSGVTCITIDGTSTTGYTGLD